MRVIQWATGSVGRTTLRRFIDDPRFDLAGVYVTNPAKVGLDAGDIAKRSKTGVLATSDIEEILALDADVVIHTPMIPVPYDQQNDVVARLLASGKNVVSTNGFYRPGMHGDGYAGPLLAAALQGGVTLAGGGLNPGFIAERLAVGLTAMVARLDHIRCREVFDASLTDSAVMVFKIMGFATDPRQQDLRTGPLAHLYNQLYGEVFDYVADKLGTEVVSIEPQHALTFAPDDIQLKPGIIPKGTVAATTWRWFGTFANGTTMTHEILWTSSHALHDEQEGGHWTIELLGRPNVRMTLDLSDPDSDAPWSRPAMDASAAAVISLLGPVVAAKPGFFDLPALAPVLSA